MSLEDRESLALYPLLKLYEAAPSPLKIRSNRWL
jgi:hypothetical protein